MSITFKHMFNNNNIYRERKRSSLHNMNIYRSIYIYIFLDKSFDLDLKDDLYFKVMESLINLML